MFPLPVALISARMPLPAPPLTMPLVLTVTSPVPFWIVTTPLAAPVRLPESVSMSVAGVPALPPDAVRSTASPLVVMTLPRPVMAKVPPPVAVAAIVPLKPSALSSCSVSLPPAKVIA
ncbi:hypothetical protein JQ577_25800 [Bradyrhizobium diazoefficiens]|nr:hypothetical protein [Bradyrhizobium diazoefficiens]MBR1111869.1 hypothetical protein [Bradyrhizobium diazoefficiens]